MQTCLIRDLMKVLICCQFCPSHGLCFPVEYIQLTRTCKPLIIHFSYDLLFFIYYWKINSCLWSASDANHFIFFFFFPQIFIYFGSALFFTVVKNTLKTSEQLHQHWSSRPLSEIVLSCDAYRRFLMCQVFCPSYWWGCLSVYFVYICILSSS